MEPSSFTAAKAPPFPTTWRKPPCNWDFTASEQPPSSAIAPRHNRAVFLHCGEGSAISHDVANAALQLGLHGVRVTSTICAAPREDGAVFFESSEGPAVPDDVLDTASQLGLDLLRVAPFQ